MNTGSSAMCPYGSASLPVAVRLSTSARASGYPRPSATSTRNGASSANSWRGPYSGARSPRGSRAKPLIRTDPSAVVTIGSVPRPLVEAVEQLVAVVADVRQQLGGVRDHLVDVLGRAVLDAERLRGRRAALRS